MVKERSIVTCILLTIVTCGIYGLFWFVSLIDDVCTLQGKQREGVKTLLLSLITCNIYGLYKWYVIGTEMDQINGNSSGSTGIIYLLLNLFGLNIVTYALCQSEINKKAN